MSSTESRDSQISNESELKRSRDSIEGTADHLSEAPQNIAQRITDQLVSYLMGSIALDTLLGEMAAAIAELDATKSDRAG